MNRFEPVRRDVREPQSDERAMQDAASKALRKPNTEFGDGSKPEKKKRAPISLDELNEMDARDAERESATRERQRRAEEIAARVEKDKQELRTMIAGKAKRSPESLARGNAWMEGIKQRAEATMRAQRDVGVLSYEDHGVPLVKKGEASIASEVPPERKFKPTPEPEVARPPRIPEAARRNETKSINLVVHEELQDMGVPSEAMPFFQNNQVIAMLERKGFSKAKDKDAVIADVAEAIAVVKQRTFEAQGITIDSRGNPKLPLGRSIWLRVKGIVKPDARKKEIQGILNSEEWQTMKAMMDTANVFKGILKRENQANGVEPTNEEIKWDADLAKAQRGLRMGRMRDAGKGALLVGGALALGGIGAKKAADAWETKPVDSGKPTTEVMSRTVVEDAGDDDAFPEMPTIMEDVDLGASLSFEEPKSLPEFEPLKASKEKAPQVKKAGVDVSAFDVSGVETAVDRRIEVKKSVGEVWDHTPKEVQKMVNQFLDLRRERKLDQPGFDGQVGKNIREALRVAQKITETKGYTGGKHRGAEVNVYRKELLKVHPAFEALGDGPMGSF